MTDDPQHHAYVVLDSDEVAVPKRSLRELRGLLIGVVVGGLLGIGSFVWFAYQQDRTNDHLARSDAAAEQDRAALERLVRREDQEEDIEAAVRCVRDHLRYAEFLELAEALTAAGAQVGTDAHLSLLGASDAERHAAHAEIDRLLPGAVQPIIDRYPAPACDRVGAEHTLAAAPPEMVEQARDGR